MPDQIEHDANVLKLYKGNRKLFDRLLNWVKGLLQDVKAAGKALSQRGGSWAQMDALKNDRKAMQEIYDRMMAVMEKAGKTSEQEQQGVKLSAKEASHYDYSKPFFEQVADLREGRFPKNDALLVSGTPEVLQKIGFSNLPLTINQAHLLNMEKDLEHVLSNELIRQLPELLKDPVAVIESQSANDSSIVMILKAIINEKPYVAPVYISSQSQSNMALIDSNNISTTFRKKML